MRFLAPLCAAGSGVSANDDPIEEGPREAVCWLLFCVFVEEVHHAVGDHVTPVLDAFVLVEGGEDEAYVVFFEAVRYWDLDVFFIDVGWPSKSFSYAWKYSLTVLAAMCCQLMVSPRARDMR